MATALQPLRWTSRSCNCRTPIYQFVSSNLSATSTVPTRAAGKRWKTTKARSANLNEVEQSLETFTKSNESIVKLLGSVKTTTPTLTRAEYMSMGQSPPFMEKQKKKRPKDTFLNMGDPEPWEEDGQLEDDHDDITSLGHGELERHREMRHYARLAAWEMPLLANMAKPFEPPTAEMPLRFRYTSYLGEQHPAEKKVVLEFAPGDMPNLTNVQREKLKKLAGPRYNPEKDIVKMSCDSFETQAQNKRYLGDLVDSLLHESKTGDTFEDVPLDLRHHRVKPKPKFPQEWALTEKRKVHLEQLRVLELQSTQQQQLDGSIVDGKRLISDGITQAKLKKAAEPELVLAGKGKKQVSVKR